MIRAIADGRMVVLLDDEDRENEGDLVMAADRVRPEDINFMAREGRGLICLALTRDRCRQLRLPPMVSENRTRHGTAFTVSIEAASGVTTGISAHDRAHTIRTAVARDASPEDLHQPGHVFPLTAREGGVLTRAGHTEAAVDLARLAGCEPAGVIVEVMGDDGRMARRPELEVFARRHGLEIGTIADLIRYRLETESTIERLHTADVTTAFGPMTLHVYGDCVGEGVHYALVRGEVESGEPVLVRVHVQGVLADLAGIARDGFGSGIERALRRIAAAECGVLVVINETTEVPALMAALASQSMQGDAGNASSAGTGAADAHAAEVHGDAHAWRRNGLGAQILVDLGVRRLHALGSEQRQIALDGFGLEVLGVSPL